MKKFIGVFLLLVVIAVVSYNMGQKKYQNGPIFIKADLIKVDSLPQNWKYRNWMILETDEAGYSMINLFLSGERIYSIDTLTQGDSWGNFLRTSEKDGVYLK
ncbi:hypothetical protein KAI52_04095 [Candidatus Parcubacteria bacterium]|nr:hypothetical protein [Candidatus Parcubacteria bacterium]